MGFCCCFRRSGRKPLLAIVPSASRSCTDIIFLLLFVCVWCGLFWVVHLAAIYGDPARLAFNHGADMNGLTCGISPGVEGQPYAAWPFPTVYQSLICVSDCSATTSDPRMALPMPSTPFLYYCIPDPFFVNQTQLDNFNSVVAAAAANNSSPAPAPLTSADFQHNSDSASSVSAAFSRAIHDVVTAAPIIASSIPFTIILCFLYLICLRGVAGLMVWGMIGAFLVAGGIGGAALLQHAEALQGVPGQSDQAVNALKALAYTVLAITVLFAFVVLALRKRIQIAIEVVKESARAIGAIKSVLFFPLFVLLLAMLFALGWLTMALYMYSVGTYQPQPTSSLVRFSFTSGAMNSNPPQTQQFVVDPQFKQYFALHFFALLWNMDVLVYFAYMVIAGAVADWYFTPKSKRQREEVIRYEMERERQEAGTTLVHTQPIIIHPKHGNDNGWVKNEDGETKGGGADSTGSSSKLTAAEKKEHDRLEHVHSPALFPVLASLYRTVRFHLGTIALGALLLAIIQFIRAVLHYIQLHTAKKGNCIQAAVFCLLQCCLKCLQCCLDKINKNALIYCAIYGDDFGISCCSSFQLVWANLMRVAAVYLVGDYLLFVGKLLVSFLSMSLCLLILTYREPYSSELSSTLLPCIIIFILSYYVTGLFMMVFHTTIDTVFLCFLVDVEKNQDGVMMASDGLRELIGNYEHKSKEEAAVIKGRSE